MEGFYNDIIIEQRNISLRTNEVEIEQKNDEFDIEKKDYNSINQVHNVYNFQYLVIKKNIEIPPINIQIRTESNYGKLDINKDYYLACPVCKSDEIKLKKAIYNEENNDFEISYSCGNKIYNEFLFKFFAINNGKNFLTQKNYLIIKEILENRIDGFEGYPFLEKMLQNKSIGYNRFDICDDINNPITNIFWIDENINSDKKQEYFKILKDVFQNVQIFDNEQSMFEIIEQMKFEVYIIIMNGRNFHKYIDYLLNNSIYGIPVCAIFITDEIDLKEPINKEYKIYIKDKFYNPLGLSISIDDLIRKIKNFMSSYVKRVNNINLGYSSPPSNYKDCFIFEFIDDDNKLIFPYLYNNIMQNSNITDNDIKKTNKYILKKYGENDEIKKLIVSLINIENIPSNIIGKFWGRIYTIESSFYRNLNNNLMKLDNEHYNEYIQMLYKGLKEFEFKENDILYRGTNISDEEVENILNFYKNKKNNDENQPKYLIYSRAFISFSKDREVSMNFIKDIPKTKKILFQLKNNFNIKNLSNASLSKISVYPSENEILFFPFSSFIIENIIKKEDIYHISLEYLGIYEEKIKSKIKAVDKKVMNNIIENSNFSKDAIKINILPKKVEKNDEIINDTKELNIINNIIEYNNEVNFNNVDITSEINCVYNSFENIFDLLYKDICKVNKEINDDNLEIFVDGQKIKFNTKYVNKKKGDIKVKFKFSKLLENISYLFYNCSSLKSIDFSLFNSVKLKDMSYLCSGCISLESINLSSLNSNKIKDISCMFSGCYSLKSIDMSSMNTDDIENIKGLFNNCFSLKFVKLPLFDSKKVKDASTIFNGCSSLDNKNINFLK